MYYIFCIFIIDDKNTEIFIVFIINHKNTINIMYLVGCCGLAVAQPRTQALSTTRLAGGKTLVQAGHVSPRFWEITIGTYRG